MGFEQKGDSPYPPHNYGATIFAIESINYD